MVLALAASVLGPAPLTASDAIPIAAAVVFNTACARCHEGECSGRMSLDLPRDAADEHVRRHGGALPDETVRQLGELLRYMKEQCAFYPLPLALATDRVWGQDSLDQLRSPAGTAYFLPLGRLGAGEHRLRIDGLEPGIRTCVDLVTADFDSVTPEAVTQEGEQRGLRFRIDTPVEVFLRITAERSITMTRAELVGEAAAGGLGSD